METTATLSAHQNTTDISKHPSEVDLNAVIKFLTVATLVVNLAIAVFVLLI